MNIDPSRLQVRAGDNVLVVYRSPRDAAPGQQRCRRQDRFQSSAARGRAADVLVGLMKQLIAAQQPTGDAADAVLIAIDDLERGERSAGATQTSARRNPAQR